MPFQMLIFQSLEDVSSMPGHWLTPETDQWMGKHGALSLRPNALRYDVEHLCGA